MPKRTDLEETQLWEPWPDTVEHFAKQEQPTQVAPVPDVGTPATEAATVSDFSDLYEGSPTPKAENIPEQMEAEPVVDVPTPPPVPAGMRPSDDQEVNEVIGEFNKLRGFEPLAGVGTGSETKDRTLQLGSNFEELYSDPMQGIPETWHQNRPEMGGEPIQVAPGKYIWQYIEVELDPEEGSYRTLGQALVSQFGNADYHRHLVRNNRFIVEQDIETPINEFGDPTQPYAKGAKRILYPNLANLRDWSQAEGRSSFRELPADRQKLFKDSVDPTFLALGRAFEATRTKENPGGDLIAASRAWEQYFPEDELVEARMRWNRLVREYEITAGNEGLSIKSRTTSPEALQRAISFKMQAAELADAAAPEFSQVIPEEFTTPTLSASIMDAFYKSQSGAGFSPVDRITLSINGRPVNDYFGLDWAEDITRGRAQAVATPGDRRLPSLLPPVQAEKETGTLDEQGRRVVVVGEDEPGTAAQGLLRSGTNDYKEFVSGQLYKHPAYTAIVAALTPTTDNSNVQSRLIRALQTAGASETFTGLTPSEQAGIATEIGEAVAQDPNEIVKVEVQIAGGNNLVISGKRKHLARLANNLRQLQPPLRIARNNFAQLMESNPEAVPEALQNVRAFIPEGRLNRLYSNNRKRGNLQVRYKELVTSYFRNGDDSDMRDLEVVEYQLGMREPWQVREFIERAVSAGPSIQSADVKDINFLGLMMASGNLAIGGTAVGEWNPPPTDFRIEEPIWINPPSGASEKELGRLEFRNFERLNQEDIAPFLTDRFLSLASKVGTDLYGDPVPQPLDFSTIAPGYGGLQRDVLQPGDIKAAIGGTPVDSYGNVVLPSDESLPEEQLEILRRIADENRSTRVPRITALDQAELKDIMANWNKSGQTPLEDVHNYIQDLTDYQLVSPEQWEEQEGGGGWGLLMQLFHTVGYPLDWARRDAQLGVMLGQELVGKITPEWQDNWSRDKYFHTIFRDFDFEGDELAEETAREVANRYHDIIWGETDFTESAIAHSYDNADTWGFESAEEGDFKMFNPSVKYYFEYAVSPEQAYFLDKYAPEGSLVPGKGLSWQWKAMRSPVAKEVLEMASWIAFDPLLWGGIGRSARAVKVGDDVLIGGSRFSGLSRDLAILSEKSGNIGLRGEHAWAQLLAETQVKVRRLQAGGLSQGERMVLVNEVKQNLSKVRQVTGDARAAAGELRAKGQRMSAAGDEMKNAGGTPPAGGAAEGLIAEYTEVVRGAENARDLLGTLQKPSRVLETEADRVAHAAQVRKAETRVARVQAELDEILNPNSSQRWFHRNGKRHSRSANKMEHMADDVESTLSFLKGERDLNGIVRGMEALDGGLTYGARFPKSVPGIGGKRIPGTRDRQLLREAGRLGVHLPIYGTSRTMDLIPAKLAKKLGIQFTPEQIARTPLGARGIGTSLRDTTTKVRAADKAAYAAKVERWKAAKKAAADGEPIPRPGALEPAKTVATSGSPGWLREPFVNYEQMKPMVQDGLLQFSDLTTGEKFIYMTGSLLGSAIRFPPHVYEVFRKSFGTTAARPLINRTSDSLLSRVPAVIWDAYVDAMRQFTRKHQFMESELLHQVNRITERASEIADFRRKEAKLKIKNLTKEIAAKEFKKYQAGGDSKLIASLDLEIKVLEAAIQEQRLFTAPGYNARVVLQEAADQIETGAGLLKSRPEMGPIVAEVSRLIDDMSAGVAVEEAALRQALALMQRTVRADPEYIAQLQSMMTLARSLIDTPEVVAIDRILDLRKMYGAAARERAAVRGLLKRATPEQLANVLEQVRANIFNETVEQTHRAWLRKVLTDTFEGNQAAVRGFEDSLKTAMGIDDSLLAIRKLLSNLKATKNGLRWTKKFAVVTADMVRNTALRLDAEGKQIERFLLNEVSDYLVGEAKISLDSTLEELRNVSAILADEHFITAQSIIGDANWGSFKRWARTGEGEIPPNMVGQYEEARKQMERYYIMRDIVPAETAREAAILSSVMDSAESLAIKQEFREAALDTRATPEEIEAIIVVAEGRAFAWALETGRAPSEWWAFTLAGVKKGRGRLPADALFQLHEGGAPVFYSELRLYVEREWPTRKNNPKVLTNKQVLDFVTNKRAKSMYIKAEELADNELIFLLDAPGGQWTRSQVLEYIDRQTMPINIRTSETLVGDVIDPYVFVEWDRTKGLPPEQFSRRGEKISSTIGYRSEPVVGAMWSPVEIFTIEGRNRKLAAMNYPEVLSLPGSTHEIEVVITGDAKSGRTSLYPESDNVMGVKGGKFSYHREDSHWPVDNVIAHFRAGVREVTTSDGRTVRTLHLAELQSDLHKLGKEIGYGKDAPYTPFMKTWLSLTLKAATRKAAELGLDGVSFDTGATQILRYKGPQIARRGKNLRVRVHQANAKFPEGFGRHTRFSGVESETYSRSGIYLHKDAMTAPRRTALRALANASDPAETLIRGLIEEERFDYSALVQQLGRKNAKRIEESLTVHKDGLTVFTPTAEQFTALDKELTRLGDDFGKSFAKDFMNAPAPPFGIRDITQEIQHRWRYAQQQRRGNTAFPEGSLAFNLKHASGIRKDPLYKLSAYLDKNDLVVMSNLFGESSVMGRMPINSETLLKHFNEPNRVPIVFPSGNTARAISALKAAPKSEWGTVLRGLIKEDWRSIGRNNWSSAKGVAQSFEAPNVSKVIEFGPEAFAATQGSLGSWGHLISYDTVIPSTAKKLYKKFGMKVDDGKTHVPSGRWLEDNQGYELSGGPLGNKGRRAFEQRIGSGDQRWSYDNGVDVDVRVLEFTDDFRKQALGDGQPYYQMEKGVKKGAVRFLEEDGKAILYLYKNADASTFIHEMGHIMRRQLPKYQLQAAETFSGVKGGKWTVEAEEKFARAFERFVYEHIAPKGASKELMQAFSTLKTSMQGIYEELRGSKIDIELSPAVEKLFADMSYGRTVKERLATKLASEALTGRKGVVEAASKAGFGERTLIGMTEGIGPFNKETATMYRLKSAVQGAQTEQEAVARVREALWKLHKNTTGDKDLATRYVNRLAKKLGRRLFETESTASPRVLFDELSELKDRAFQLTKKADAAAVAGLPAREEWVRKKTVEIDSPKAPAKLAALEAEMSAQLSLRLPSKDLKGGEFVRELNEWERKLWLDFNELTKNLTQKDKLLAAFSALKDLPSTPEHMQRLWKVVENDLGLTEGLAKEWTMGTRLGPADEVIAPVVNELRNLITRYEKLYEENGMNFMANPTVMLQKWGVVDYFPHMWIDGASVLTPAGSQRASGIVESGRRNRQIAREPVSLDERLLANMDAAQQRGILGTIREINMQLDSKGAFGVDPLMIASRYIQANKKITARQFLFALLDTGVIEQISPLARADGTVLSATQIARERGYVPLIARHSDEIEMISKEHILFGTRGELAELGMTSPAKLEELLGLDLIEEVSGLLKTKTTVRQGLFWKKAKFASWAEEAPVIRMALKIEDAIAAIRYAELKSGKPKLINVREIVASALELGDEAQVSKALDLIADSLSKKAYALTRERFKISGKDLRTYFAPGQEGWKLYVPEQVVVSMNEILGAAVPEWSKGVKGGFDKIQNFWKVRLTVMAVAFHARNHISNVAQNWLHLDAPALFSPSMNNKATGLALAVSHYEKYGSMVNARKAFSAPKSARETMGAYARRKASGSLFESTFGRWIDDGIDMGDGVVRSLDESIGLMKEHGVLSESFTQYVDIAEVESNLLEMMAKNGLGGTMSNIKRGLSYVEDVAVVGLPMMITGGIPVTLPKGLGASLGRVIENQARTMNWMGSLNQGYKMTDAANFVAKFLFDYNDLTSFQKQWMRTFFPFFTWNNKNFWLQLEMLQKNPGYYSTFNHLMYEGLPNIANATMADSEFPNIRPVNPNRLSQLARRPHHSRHRISLPIPYMKNVYFEGFGLPQEGFNEWINPFIDAGRSTRDGLLGALNGQDYKSLYWNYSDRKPLLRIVGQSNIPLRMAMELATKRQFFYDKPISELNNGRLIHDTVVGLQNHGGPAGILAAEYLTAMTGLTTVWDVDPVTGASVERHVVLGTPNWMVGASPWGRLIKQAGAYTDILSLDVAAGLGSNTSSGAYAEAVKGSREVPSTLRALEALTGLRVVQKNRELEDRIKRNRLKDFLYKTYEGYNLTRTIEMETVEPALPK